MCVELPLDKKTVENQDWATGPPGLQIAGPPGRGAVAGSEPRAAGPSGRRAAGPSRAVGRGLLDRGPAFSKTPIKGKAPGGLGIFCKGDNRSSTNLNARQKTGSKNVDRSKNLRLQKSFKIHKASMIIFLN